MTTLDSMLTFVQEKEGEEEYVYLIVYLYKHKIEFEDLLLGRGARQEEIKGRVLFTVYFCAFLVLNHINDYIFLKQI